MTTDLAEKHLRWAKRHYKVKGGQPFKTEGREWVETKFFDPAFGWRLWPNNKRRLCETCRARVDPDVFMDWSPTLIRSLTMHRRRSKNCDGLKLVPVMVTIENLVRGDGKTTNAFALLSAALADPALAPLHIQFMASAGSQTDTLIQENLLDPVIADPMMNKRFKHKGNKVTVDHGKRGKSYIEFVETSHKSNTGRRRGVIFIDEARDVSPRAVASMLPSIRSTSRFVCPAGHSQREYVDDRVFKCPTCGEVMVPFIPRVWMVSSSGLDEGEDQWFNQMVDLRQSAPVPWVYLHRSETAQNPNVSKHEEDVLSEAFADVPALRDYLAVELANVAMRKGDSFVTKADLEAISDHSVANLPGSIMECVGFLDTSWSGDLTSLIIAGWDPDECDYPWQTLRVLHWAVWDPAQQVKGVISPEAIQSHFDHHIPLFPNLTKLLVDDRGSLMWPKEFVIYQNKFRNRTFGNKIKAMHGKIVDDPKGGAAKKKLGQRIPGIYGGEIDRLRGWQFLEQRIAATTQGVPALQVPPKTLLPELHAELHGVVRKIKPDGGYDITDRSRRNRHADVVESLAGCCLLAYLEQTKPRTSLTAEDVDISHGYGEHKDSGLIAGGINRFSF